MFLDFVWFKQLQVSFFADNFEIFRFDSCKLRTETYSWSCFHLPVKTFKVQITQAASKSFLSFLDFLCFSLVEFKTADPAEIASDGRIHTSVEQ